MHRCFVCGSGTYSDKAEKHCTSCLSVMVVSTVHVYWCYIGDMSWVMRIQNHSHYQTSPLDFPLTDITTLFMPSLASRKEQQFGNFVSGHARINSENLAESEYDVCISLGISLMVSILCHYFHNYLCSSNIIAPLLLHHVTKHHFSYTSLQNNLHCNLV